MSKWPDKRPVAPSHAPPVQAATVTPAAHAEPSLYLLRKAFRFHRNGSFIALEAGTLLRRDRDGGLIDDAIRLGAQLDGVSEDKVTFCPHCRKAIVGQ